MTDALLLFGDSETDPNMFYKTGFLVGDPVVYLETPLETVLVVGSFEGERARSESAAGVVRTVNEFGFTDVLLETGSRDRAFAAVMERLLREHDLDVVAVEPSFPVLQADLLREAGITLDVGALSVEEERRTKRADEIDAVEASQQAAERALERAVALLRESEERDGLLYVRGIALTAERLRGEIDASLLESGMDTSQTAIVAPGKGAAEPHWTGSGQVRAGEAIVFDLFPRGRTSRYFGDITRTVVKGEPSELLQRMYDATLRAQQAALALLRPGVSGADVHAAVERVYEEAGFAGEGEGPRYIHGTGHGVGLQVHEAPWLRAGAGPLQVGDVVTIEPGLYDPNIGAVRIEDTVAITEDGHRNLTRFPKEFRV